MFYGTPDHILLHVYASWVSTARRSTHGRADDPENQSHQQDEEHEHDHQRKPVSLLRLPHSWPSPADREDRCQRCGLWFLGIAWCYSCHLVCIFYRGIGERMRGATSTLCQ